MSTLNETTSVSMDMTELTAPPAYEPYQPRNLLLTPLHYFYLLFLVLFYVLNLIIFIFSLWLDVMETESYLLDVTVSPDNRPLMRWAVGLGIVSGAISMVVCSLGVLELFGKVRSVLSVFIFGLAIVSFMQGTQGLIAREFKKNFDKTALKNFTSDLALHRYGVNPSASLLMDKVQFYNDCCGAKHSEEYYFSEWFMKHRDTDKKAFVPLTCCKMKEESTFSDMKPLNHTCNKVMYTAHIFQYLVKKKGCADVFSEKVLQYPALFELLGLFMTFYTVCVLVFVLLMVDKKMYYDLSFFT